MEKTLRILVVDDNPDDRALIKRELSREFPRVQVTEVADAQAQTLALAGEPQDLAITDYQLGWSNGLAILRDLKARWPHCPVVMFTGTGSEEVAVEAMKNGLDDYVLKTPRHYIRLVASVNKALKRTKERLALLAAEDRYSRLFKNAPIGLYRIAAQGEIVEANPALVHLLGYPDRKTLLAAKLEEFYVDPADKERWQDQMQHRGEVRGFELQLRQRDDSAIWVRNNAQAIRDEQGHIWYYEGSLEDITKEKQAELNLEHHYRFLQTLIDSIPAPLFYKDAQGIYLGCNKVFEQYFGITQEQIVGKTVFGLSPRDLADVYRQKDEELFRHPGVQIYEGQVELPDRTRRTVVYHKATFVDTDGTLGGLIGVVLDITERKQAEEAFRILVNSAPMGIYIMQDGKFKMVNPGFVKICGYSEEELIGCTSLNLVAPDYREEVRQNAIRMLKGESHLPYEFPIITKSGETRWMVEQVISIVYQGERAAMGYFLDISEHKSLESQFLQAQKMEAVGRLAGGVAHDFNNMLNVIIGYGDLMNQELHQHDPLARYLTEIMKAADRAASLTRQLLAFSQKQISQPQVLNLNDTIRAIQKMLERLISEDIEMAVVLAPSLGAVKADPTHIDQIIINLVVNARDAMPLGGKLTLETANVSLDESYVQRHAYVTPGPYVMLAVSDNGQGMDAATQARIFEPFFTTKEDGKGTGLGLSTVYGIVKQNGGYIQVYSEIGQGTTFKVYLPQVQEAVSEIPTPEPRVKELYGSETILVVEDEEQLGNLIYRSLKSYGYTVLVARHGGEALLLCERHPGPIHLLLTDVVMPQMSGRDLSDRLAPLLPDMKVLYMSGYTGNAVVHHGVLDPTVSFIQKPFSAQILVEKIRKILDDDVR
jgi:PAS domain S-box-containing protein